MKKMLSAILAALIAVSAGSVIGSAESTSPSFSSGYVTDADLTENTSITAPEKWGAVPDEAQLYYQTQGISAFCHFGLNTFNNVEWGESYRDTDLRQLFTLNQDFDADNIVKTMKDAGFSRIILTCKHHDGFALWNCSDVYEKYGISDYSINATNYDGDILEELSDACTKYNMDMGFYLSPWDIHLQNEGIFGSYLTTEGFRQKKAGTPDAECQKVAQNSSGAYLTYQNVYNDFYIDQIKSVLYSVKTDEDGNELYNEDGTPQYKYGNNNPNRRTDRFIELWMDGATGTGAAPQYYNWARITETVREECPSCLIFGTNGATNDNTNDKIFNNDINMGGIHWIGNENGVANSTTWSKLNQGAPGYENTAEYPRQNGAIVGKYDGNIWSVPEVDTKILNSGWFWSAGKQSSLLSLQRLGNVYFNSVGNGAVLLLNMSPNSSGTLDTNQMNRFKEFGNALKDTFGTDFTKQEGAAAAATSVYGNSAAYAASNVIDSIPEGEIYDNTYWSPADGQTTGSVEINFNGLKTFDVVSIEEYIQLGQRISGFSVEYKTSSGIWKNFAQGTTVGSKKLVRSSEVTATAVRVNVTSSYALPMINNIGVYKAVEAFEVEGDAVDDSGLATDLENYTYTSFTQSVQTGGWQTANGRPDAWSTSVGATETYTVTGSQIAVSGIRDPGHGAMTVTIDGTVVAVVDTNAAARAENQILYVSDELEYGQHTVVLTATNNNLSTPKSCIDIYGVYSLDMGGKGIISVEKPEYRTCSASTQVVKIVRRFGSKGEASVNYATATGSAEQNVGYVYQDGTITFADGETEKEITIRTLYNTERGNEIALYFYFALYKPEDSQAVLGKNVDPKIYIEPINTELTFEDLENAVLKATQIYPSEFYTDSEAYALFEQRLEEAKKYLSYQYSSNLDTENSGIEIGAKIRALELAADALTFSDEIVGDAIPQSQLTASAENFHNGNGAQLAVDGNTDTRWHTMWAGDANAVMPDFENNVGNGIVISLPRVQDVAKLTYVPRQDTSTNGDIIAYEVLYSAADSGDDWKLAASGTWAANKTQKQAVFAPVRAKRVMLRAKSTIGDGNQDNKFVCAAEINVYAAAEFDSALPAPIYTGTEITANSFVVHWIAPARNENITGYVLKLDGEIVAEVDAADKMSYEIAGLTPHTDYEVSIYAKYADGSLSEPITFFALTEEYDGPVPPTPDYILGDANGDGQINAADAATILQYFAGIIDSTQIDLRAASVSEDTEINAVDAAMILQFFADIIDEFALEANIRYWYG